MSRLLWKPPSIRCLPFIPSYNGWCVAFELGVLEVGGMSKNRLFWVLPFLLLLATTLYLGGPALENQRMRARTETTGEVRPLSPETVVLP